MDEDTKTEEVIKLDMSHATSAELLADRDHWERDARAWKVDAAAGDTAVAYWKKEYDRVVAKLEECVTREYMEVQLGVLQRSLDRRRAELLHLETEVTQAKRDMAAQVEELASARANERSAIAALTAQGDALDAARLAEQRWYTEAKRLHDQAEELVEGLQEADNAGADRSRLEVAQHAVKILAQRETSNILAQRETSPRLMRALFELAVAEHEERSQREAKNKAAASRRVVTPPAEWGPEAQARLEKHLRGDAAGLAGDPEAGS